MGLLDLFKPKKQDVHEFLEKYNIEQGNYVAAFEQRHHEKLNAWAAQITNSRVAASQAVDESQRLGLTLSTKSLLDGLEDWCKKQEYGQEYFTTQYGGMYSRVEKELQELDVILNTIIPAILQADGVLQSDFVKQFDVDPDVVRNQIWKLEKEGYITREKQGRSYIIRKKS